MPLNRPDIIAECIELGLAKLRFNKRDIVLQTWSESDARSRFRDAHFHESWEIKIALSGHLELLDPSGPDKLKEKQILLVPPKCIHRIEPQVYGDDATYLGFTLDKKLATLNVVHEGREIQCFLTSSQQSSWIDLLRLAPGEHLDRLRPWLSSAPEHYLEASFRLLLSSLHMTLCLEGEKTKPSRSLVVRALDMMEARYFDHNLSVVGISRHLGVSSKHLAKCFRQERGAGPRQCLIELRLKKARDLLKEGELPVKKIAWLTGWANEFYFSSSYRSHYGYPPSKEG